MPRKSIINWYKSVIALILLIIAVGGITRLTGSGLSMVNWQPVFGLLPPLTNLAWQDLFNQYKEFPQYQLENAGMTLSDFKFIFFWEYLHRVIGRLIGLALILPFLYFLIKKQLNKFLIKRSLIMIALVILQGLMGWYMVKSGLVDRPSVSHFRLAAHLFLAFLLLQYILWTILDLGASGLRTGYVKIKSFLLLTLAALLVQIGFGAFTAGLKAGYYYNTYPLMGGEFAPQSLFLHGSLLDNIFYNPIMIQFIHRHFAVVLTILVAITLIKILKSELPILSKQLAYFAFGLLLLQFTLGVMTLIYALPIGLAVFHQFTAILLLSTWIAIIHLTFYKR